MGKTEKELMEIVAGRKYINGATAKRLEESAKRFDSLISRGLAHPRGYNLMTADNNHVVSVRFNIPAF